MTVFIGGHGHLSIRPGYDHDRIKKGANMAQKASTSRALGQRMKKRANNVVQLVLADTSLPLTHVLDTKLQRLGRYLANETATEPFAASICALIEGPHIEHLADDLDHVNDEDGYSIGTGDQTFIAEEIRDNLPLLAKGLVGLEQVILAIDGMSPVVTYFMKQVLDRLVRVQTIVMAMDQHLEGNTYYYPEYKDARTSYTTFVRTFLEKLDKEYELHHDLMGNTMHAMTPTDASFYSYVDMAFLKALRAFGESINDKEQLDIVRCIYERICLVQIEWIKNGAPQLSKAATDRYLYCLEVLKAFGFERVSQEVVSGLMNECFQPKEGASGWNSRLQMTSLFLERFKMVLDRDTKQLIDGRELSPRVLKSCQKQIQRFKGRGGPVKSLLTDLKKRGIALEKGSAKTR